MVCDKMDTAAQYKYQQHVQYFEDVGMRYATDCLFNSNHTKRF